MWQESLEIIPRMWTEDPFEYQGRFVNVPPRSIIPKPLQKPHPPIWMAATSPQSWELAGTQRHRHPRPDDLRQRARSSRTACAPIAKR